MIKGNGTKFIVLLVDKLRAQIPLRFEIGNMWLEEKNMLHLSEERFSLYSLRISSVFTFEYKRHTLEGNESEKG